MILSTNDPAKQVAALLELLPGVAVISASASADPPSTHIAMRIVSLESFARVVHYCSVGVNIAVDVRPGGQPLEIGRPFDVGNLRYHIDIPELAGSEPPSRIQILGILLARDLKHLQLMDRADADALQIAWKAVVM